MKVKWLVPIGLSVLAVGAAVAIPVMMSHKGEEEELPQTGTMSEYILQAEPPAEGDPTQYSGLENVSYMAYRLAHTSAYRAESYSTVTTKVAFISYTQSVETYKDYADGVMVVSDIARSSLVNSALQTCFVNDRALWRSPESDKEKDWDGKNTAWAEDDPANYSVDEYMQIYGLPCTEFSLYCLTAETLTEWSEVTDNGDGTYTQTIYPDEETAGNYYKIRMKTMGGLSKYPEFKSIAITYTFDSQWRVLSSVTEETYSVDMGILHSDNCAATTTQTYFYDDEANPDLSAYENFFSRYVEKESQGGIGDLPAERTATDYLSAAFAPVLISPVQFDAALTLGESELAATVYIDLANTDIRAEIPGMGLWFCENTVYLSVREELISLPVETVKSFLGGDGEGGDLLSSLDTDALLSQLAEGQLTVTESGATLETELELFGFTLPLRFSFTASADGEIGLEYVSLSDFRIEGVLNTPLSARLSYSDKENLSALSDGQKAAAVDISPYISDIVDLVEAESYDITLQYGEIIDVTAHIAKTGTIGGNFALAYEGLNVSGEFAYLDNIVYLSLNREGEPLKLSVNAEELIAYVSGKLGSGTELQLPGIENIIETVLGLDLTTVVPELCVTADELRVVLNGDELCKLLGLSLEIGNIELGFGAGQLDVSAGALHAGLAAGEKQEISVVPETYTDVTPVIDYLDDILSLAEGGKLNIGGEAEIETNGVKVGLELTGNVAWKEGLQVYASVLVTVGNTQSEIEIEYKSDTVRVAYGKIGVEVKTSEIDSLATAFEEIYNRFNAKEALVLSENGLNLGKMLDSLRLQISESENAGLEIVLGLLGQEGTITYDRTTLNITTEIALNNVTVRADLDVTRGESVGAIAEGVNYLTTDKLLLLCDYVGEAIDLIQSENFDITLQYGEIIDVTAHIAKTGTIGGNFALAYEGLNVSGEFAYLDNIVYLDLNREGEPLKLNVNAEELITYISGKLGSGTELQLPGIENIIETVLGLDLTTVVPELCVTADELRVVLNGDELCKLLGLSLEIGNIELGFKEGRLNMSAGALHAGLAAGEKQEISVVPETYTDITPVIDYLDDILSFVENGKLNISGEAEIETNGVKVGLVLTGNIAWKEGLQVYASVSVAVGNTQSEIEIEYKGDTVRVAYGKIGVEVKTSEIDALATAFEEIYNRFNTKEALVLSENGLNLGKILDSLRLQISESENAGLEIVLGLLGQEGTITYDRTTLNITTEIALNNVTVRADLDVTRGESVGAIAEGVNYLTTDKLLLLCDYVGEAIDLVEATEWNLEYTMSVNMPSGAMYNVDGGAQIIRADETGALALALTLNVVATDPAADSYYFELSVKNGYIYLSVSYYEDGNENRNPLYIKAEMKELKELLNTVGGLLNLDLSFIEDLINNFKTAGESTESVKTAIRTNDFFKTLTVSAERIELALNADKIYGATGLNDLLLTVERDVQAGGLSLIRAQNIYYSVATQAWLDVSLALKSEPCAVTEPENAADYIDASTVNGCVDSFVRSFLNIEGGELKLLDGYYFAGQLTGTVGKLEVAFDVALNVKTENGRIVINATIGAESTLFVNSGRYLTSLTFDTVSSMIYIQRTQYEYYKSLSFKTYDVPVVTYRAMTLEEFGADYWSQIVYITNMGDTLANLVKNAIDSGSGSGNTGAKTDVGEYLKNYSYDAQNRVYSLTVNGKPLASFLGDINLNITCDEDGLVRNIEGDVNIYITLGLNIDYENVTKKGGDYSLTISSLADEWGKEGYQTSVQSQTASASSLSQFVTYTSVVTLYNGDGQESLNVTFGAPMSGLTVLEDTDTHRFMGWYTQENGMGERVWETTVDNGYGGTALYAYWKGYIRADLTLYSELELDGYIYDENLGCYVYVFENYRTGDELPAVTKDGYVSLGWWYESENGWAQVTAQTECLNAQTKIKVMWAKADITASVSNLKKMIKSATITVEGSSCEIIGGLDAQYTASYYYYFKKLSDAEDATSTNTSVTSSGTYVQSCSVTVTYTIEYNGQTIGTVQATWNS